MTLSANLMTQQKALLTHLKKDVLEKLTSVLGAELEASWEKDKKEYRIDPKDSLLVCQGKAALNAIIFIENNPQLAKILIKYLAQERGVVNTAIKLNRIEKQAEKFENHIERIAYYSLQQSNDLLSQLPQVKELREVLTSVAKALTVYQNISAAFSNPDLLNKNLENHLGNNLNVDSIKIKLTKLVDEVRRDATIFIAKIEDNANKGIDNFTPVLNAQKNKIREAIIRCHQILALASVNFGINTADTQKLLENLTKPFFNCSYKEWQSAMITLRDQEEENLSSLKEQVIQNGFSYATPLPELIQLSNKLRKVQSFEVQDIVKAIDTCIDERTGMKDLMEDIQKAEGELAKLSASIEKLNIGSKDEVALSVLLKQRALQEEQYPKIQAAAQKLKSLLEDRAALETSIQHPENGAYFYDRNKKIDAKSQTKISRGLIDKGKKKIVEKDQAAHVSALIGFDFALEANRLQKIAIISSQDANQAVDNNKVKEAADTIQDIMTNQINPIASRQSATDSYAALLVDLVTAGKNNDIEKIINRYSIASTRAITDEVRHQIIQFAQENVKGLAHFNKDNCEMTEGDKPVADFLKTVMRLLALIDKNAYTLQKLHAIAKTSEFKAGYKLLTHSSLQSDMKGFLEEMLRLQGIIEKMGEILSPAKDTKVLLPLVAKIQSILSPLVKMVPIEASNIFKDFVKDVQEEGVGHALKKKDNELKQDLTLIQEIEIGLGLTTTLSSILKENYAKMQPLADGASSSVAALKSSGGMILQKLMHAKAKAEQALAEHSSKLMRLEDLEFPADDLDGLEDKEKREVSVSVSENDLGPDVFEDFRDDDEVQQREDFQAALRVLNDYEPAQNGNEQKDELQQRISLGSR